MKSRLVPFLTLLLLLSVGALIGQRHYYQRQIERQGQAIALVQAQADAAQQEVARARQGDGKRQAAQAALTSAKAIAPRYDSLRKITGYEKRKTASRN